MWLLIMTSADADRFYIFSPGFSEKFSFLHTELYSPIQRQYSLEEGKLGRGLEGSLVHPSHNPINLVPLETSGCLDYENNR